jgi:hypothetical protein
MKNEVLHYVMLSFVLRESKSVTMKINFSFYDDETDYRNYIGGVNGSLTDMIAR